MDPLSRSRRIARELARNRSVYVMLAPVLAYFIVFQYVPMAGAIIAFKDFNPASGIHGSPWVGLDWFRQFFDSLFVGRVISNTILINVYDVLVGFPAPIVLAQHLDPNRPSSLAAILELRSSLPIVIVNGEELGHGAYPRREELARAAGLVAGASQTKPRIRLSAEGCCTPGSGCC